MTTPHTQAADELAELVAHLAVLRDKGTTQARTIAEQRCWREGVNAAMRLMASSALLLLLADDEPSR